jgi:hypothetical protein
LQEDEKQNCEKIYWNLWSTFWIRQRWFLSPFCNVAKLSLESHKCQNKFIKKDI